MRSFSTASYTESCGAFIQPAFTCSKLTTETVEQGVKCSKLTIKTLEQSHSRRSGVFIVKIDQVNAGRECCYLIGFY